MLRDSHFCRSIRFKVISVTAAILMAFALAIGASVLPVSQKGSVAPLNTLSDAEKREGWKLLFDGKTFNGWRGYFETEDPSKGWKIEEGCFKNSKGNGRPRSGGGDLMTAELFTDFDFRFEWSMPAGGNSGIYYLFQERQDKPGIGMYMGDDGRSPVGFEYQLLDDERHQDALRNGPNRSTGALYFLVPPNETKRLKPIGEFNESRIVVNGKHVEHWLNGAKIVEYDLGSPELIDAIARSKYKDVPGFGVKTRTRILLQDHGDEVRFRNLKIRTLPRTE
jgi:3-keto-disaccharide hydrolase